MTISETAPANPKPTFLPYLDSRQSGIHIDFLPDANAPIKEKPTFPFKTHDTPDPLAHVIKACLRTDAGSKIADLLVWFQRDCPHPPKALLPEATNPAVEKLWEQAFDHLSKNIAFEETLLQLKEQNMTPGKLTPFQPLLYCTLKKRFFPPPCPLCGSLLDLCRDDDMLATTGLDAYTQSLNRFLYCPTCYQLAGETDFYTCRSPIKEKSRAKSATDLIVNFSDLVASTVPTRKFPCRTCPEAAECHVSGGPAGHRIVPFAFYPFHIFIFMAESFDSETFTLSTATKVNNTPSPKKVHQKKRKQPPSSESIRLILNRLVSKWRFEASKASEADNLTVSPSQKRAPEPRIVSQKFPSAHDENTDNPDLNETIMVRAEKNPAPKGLKPHERTGEIPAKSPHHHPDTPADRSGEIKIDQQLPETIIVSANSKIKDDIWPKANGNDPGQSGPSAPKARGLGKKYPRDDPKTALPETMIIRPGENSRPETNRSNTNRFKTNRPSPRKPTQSVWPEQTPTDKPFTFNQASDGRHMKTKIPSSQPEEVVKAFKLGREQEPTPQRKKPMPKLPTGSNPTIVYTDDHGDDHLAETIIVKPKSNQKEDK